MPEVRALLLGTKGIHMSDSNVLKRMITIRARVTPRFKEHMVAELRRKKGDLLQRIRQEEQRAAHVERALST